MMIIFLSKSSLCSFDTLPICHQTLGSHGSSVPALSKEQLMTTRCYIFAVVSASMIRFWMMRRRIYVGKNNVHTVQYQRVWICCVSVSGACDLLHSDENEALPPNLFCVTCDFFRCT